MELRKTQHASATADNGVAKVTISVGADQAVYLCHISAEFDGNVTDVEIDAFDDATLVWVGNVPDENGFDIDFATPLKMTNGNDLVVDLLASGSAGISGTVHVWYFIA